MNQDLRTAVRRAEMIDTVSTTSSLAVRLREQIQSEGPITFHEWMKAALYDPLDGYYCRSDRIKWGREGDYRTSPERSGLFSATFASYFAKLYQQLGSPSAWTIFEGGAGDGHFAEGLLRNLQDSFPAVFAATAYVVDDLSAQSRELAAARLKSFADVDFKTLDESTIELGVVFSNELLDAFPVHRLTMSGGRLREFYVSLNAAGSFVWTTGAPGLLEDIEEYFETLGLELAEGDVAEVSLATKDWLERVAHTLRQGYVVTVDYGATAAELFSRGAGTLRGFREHQFVNDLLAQPGDCDLTTTVNWSFVKAVGERLGLREVVFERQDKFLLDAGFLQQLEIESRRCETEAERLRLTSSAREMILPEGMASHFQVLVQRKG